MEKVDPKDLNNLADEFLMLFDRRKSKNIAIDIIEDLKKYGVILELSPKTVLMRKGDSNDSIYFVLEGQVNIVVDGEEVAQLKRSGDIIGEMSIVSDERCSADVVAASNVRLLKIPVKNIKDQGPEAELLFLKILCITLSDKISITNIKAKNFEILNRSLEEEIRKRTAEVFEKNNEILLGYNKLEYMHAETMGIIKEFTRLGEKYISTTLSELRSEQPHLEIIKNNLDNLQKSISSLQTLKNDEDKMQGQKVLVIETNPRQRNLIRMALGGTGVHTILVSDIQSARDVLKDMKFRIVFLDSEFLDEAFSLSTLAPGAKFVLLTQNETQEYLTKLQNYSFISNIISLKEEDRAFNVKSISLTVRKIISGDIFGFDKYLNWGAETKQLEIRESRDRFGINQKVIDSLKDLGIRDSICNRCSLVVEELLMNAIYDAPVDSHGKAIHNHKQRTEEVSLEPHQSAKLKFATDGILLAISVEDPFGAFKKETILKYLEHNYSGSTESINVAYGKGGAGKGIYLITENSDLVIFNVSKGFKTEVIALFDLGPSSGKRNSSLHYFET